jgi:hypothetical protein
VSGQKKFLESEIERGLMEIGKRAKAEGYVLEISVYGGAALMLAYNAREATRDVDAVFERDKKIVSKLASDVAADFGWPEDWLNDGVKGFISSRDNEPDVKKLFRSYPTEDNAGLRVFVASPVYLFAMKCMAMRLGGDPETNSDVDDIMFLAKEAAIPDAQAALDVVSSFYPNNRIEAKTQFGIEEIFERFAVEHKL